MALEIFMFTGLLVFCIVMLCMLDWEMWLITWQTFWLGGISLITLMTLLSMRHINIRSRSLEQIGVRPNALLMKVYVVIWVSVFISSIILVSLAWQVQTEFEGGLDWREMIQRHYYNYMWDDLFREIVELRITPGEFMMKLRMMTAISYFFVVLDVLLFGLDIVILTTYYRFGKRMSKSMR